MAASNFATPCDRCGQLCNSLLGSASGYSRKNAIIRLMFRSENPFDFGQFVRQFAGEPGNDGRSPAFLLLPLVDDLANVPIELYQFDIDRKHRPRLGLLNSGLDLFQKPGRPVGMEGRFCSCYPPSQTKERLALSLLLQPTADFVEQAVLLPVDVPAAGVIGLPRLVALWSPALAAFAGVPICRAGSGPMLADFFVSLMAWSSSSSSALRAVRRSSAQRSSLSISASNHSPFLAESLKQLGLPAGYRVGKQTGMPRDSRLSTTCPSRSKKRRQAVSSSGVPLSVIAGENHIILGFQRLNANREQISQPLCPTNGAIAAMFFLLPE